MLLDAVPTPQQRTIAAQNKRLLAYQRTIAAQRAAAAKQRATATQRNTAALRAQIAALRRRPPVRTLPLRRPPARLGPVQTMPYFPGAEDDYMQPWQERAAERAELYPGDYAARPPSVAIQNLVHEITQARAITGHDPSRALTWMAQIKAAAPEIYAAAMARTIQANPEIDSAFDSVFDETDSLDGLGATANDVKVASSPSASDAFFGWTKGLLNLGSGIKNLISDDPTPGPGGSRTPYPNNTYPTTRPPPGYRPKAADLAMLPIMLLAGGGALYLFMTRKK